MDMVEKVDKWLSPSPNFYITFFRIHAFLNVGVEMTCSYLFEVF